MRSTEYQAHRMRLFFKKGPLFYCEYNFRLFFYLLFTKSDILVANDLDSLPAVFLASKIKRYPLVYDSHEYFTELPELVNRRSVRKIWELIEALLLPGLKHAYTVSPSIAKAYQKKYGLRMHVIRNLPCRTKAIEIEPTIRHGKEKILIYQGALNMGRGLESAIRAMQYVEHASLVIAGSGYFESELRELTKSLKLHEKVRFIGRIRPEELIQFTRQADLGISLEENKGLNYFYALPNKLFDYIQAQIPVVVTNMPEMAAIVNQYGVGRVVNSPEPEKLAEVFNEMLTDDLMRKTWKENLAQAASELCWENEEIRLLEIFSKIIEKRSR
jgi:glycosyltransferase involved in cell wall biosynthesis